VTTPRRSGNESPFSDWIRNDPFLDSIKERLCVVDTDYWIHQYRARSDRVGDRCIDSIMAIEVKTYAAGLPFAQRDTLRLVNRGMHKAFYSKDGRNVRTVPMIIDFEKRLVRIYGFFLLRLERDRPDNGWIEWNTKRIDIQTLRELLVFDRDPRTTRTRNDRRHHTRTETAQEMLPIGM
jgi:hypothetical protein